MVPLGGGGLRPGHPGVMTAIEAVATYLPDQRVPIEDRIARLDLKPMQAKLFRRFLGLSEVRLDPDGTLLDLLLAGVARLGALRGREHQVSYVLYARTMPVVVPYPLNPLHELCRLRGLDHAVAFTVTHHACATGLLAIDIAGRLLAADGEPGALALVLTGEKTFTRDAQLVPGTSVFGEGAAACLVRADGDRNRLLAYATNTQGQFNGRLEDLPELSASYEEEYPDLLAGVILAAVAQAGLTLDEISLILPHNVNVVSWQRLSRRMGFPVGRVLLENVPVTGHVFSADSFLNYATAVERHRLRPGDRFLIAAAGLGATFSAMVFEH
jgi:3-oxoacyl-[acyl-carrier-protein] synthase-3